MSQSLSVLTLISVGLAALSLSACSMFKSTTPSPANVTVTIPEGPAGPTGKTGFMDHSGKTAPMGQTDSQAQ